MSFIKNVVSILAIGSLLLGCNKASDNGSLFDSYDQKTMLGNVADAVLIPAYAQFATSTLDLKTKYTAFLTNTDSVHFVAVRSSYLQLVNSWAGVEPFNLGPINDKLWTVQINTWPVKAYKIETAITANASASTQGADAKGMKALEYLLFDTSFSTALQQLSSAPGAVDRANYTASVIADLDAKASVLAQDWAKTYREEFVQAQGNDVSSSLGLLVNAIALNLDEVKNMKVGNTVGLGVKVNDNLSHPDLVEYARANVSLSAMQQNLISLKNAFNGGAGQGIDDLLNFVQAKKDGQDLSVMVNAQFDDALTKISGLQQPFQLAVVSQKQDVVSLFQSLKKLIAFFKVDIANNLGVTITFSDTDGD